MKKTIALAAVLAALITLTACGDQAGNRGQQGDSKPSVSDTDKSNTSSKTDPSPSSGASYSPVISNVGDIKTEGDTQYFECTSKYGDAFTSVYRYTYKNGKLADAYSKIIPGKETELETILNNMGDQSDGVKASDFKKDGDGWIMTMDQAMLGAYQSIDILSLRSMMAMSMPSNPDSPNDPFTSDPMQNTSDTESSDTGSSDTVIVVSTDKDDLYEPVQTACGDIVTYGDDQYFDAFTYYGTACTVVYRYYFTKGLFDHAEMRVRPNAIPDFKEIYDRHLVRDTVRYAYSDFVKEGDDSWLLTNTTYLKEESQYFQGVDVYSLHGMMKSLSDT